MRGTLAKNSTARRSSCRAPRRCSCPCSGPRASRGCSARLADLAGHVDVGQEVHLDLEDTVALAGLAAAALDVEAEAAGLVAAHARLARLAEELADRVEDTRVRRRIRARRAADWLLVDVDDLVDVLESLDLLVFARLTLRVVEPRGDALVEDLVDERRLARAETPVTSVRVPSGNLTVRSLRLFSAAPTTSMNLRSLGGASQEPG